MRDAFRLAASTGTLTLLCLAATAAAQADGRASREIIETEFASPPASRAGDGHAASDAYLPAVEPPLQLVPVEVIGALSPLDSYPGPLGSSDGSVAGSGAAGPAGQASGGSGPGGVGSGGVGSGGVGSGGADSGSGGSGGLAEGLGGLVGGVRDGLGALGGGDSAGGGKNGND